MVCAQQIFAECSRQVLFGAIGGSRVHSVQHREAPAAFQLCKGGWTSLGWVCDRHRPGGPSERVLRRGLQECTEGGGRWLWWPFSILTCYKVIVYLFFLDSYSISSFCFDKCWSFNSVFGLIKQSEKSCEVRRARWPKRSPPSQCSACVWHRQHMPLLRVSC